MKRLPGSARSRSSSPTSIRSATRSRSCRRSTTRWAASRPTITARSSRRTGGDRTRSCRGSTRPANAPASRCTAPTGWAPTRCPTCWCSARPPASHRRTESCSDNPHKPLPQDAADAALARLARLDSATTGEQVADVANATAPHHAGALRRVPLSRPAHRGREQDQGDRERACSASRSRTRARSSTPRASKRWSSTT